MHGIGDVGTLGAQLEQVVEFVRVGALTAHQAEDDIVDLLDAAFEGDEDALAMGFADRVLTVVGELSADPRIGRATMYDTVRSHLDRLSARPITTRRLEDRLATIRLGLSFDCDSEHLELVTLCREGRALEPLLYTAADKACDVVSLAVEFESIRALDATVRVEGDPWPRLGQHHAAWTMAFDALAALAWNPSCARGSDARRILLELLGGPHTALDAAVRIQPAWLADGHLPQAFAALDAIDRWSAMQPTLDPQLDARFGAVKHAVTSLVWLAQDATRSAEVHTLWGQVGNRI